MSHDVDAIYDQGVFRPLQPLFLQEGKLVHLRVEEKNVSGNVQNYVGGIHNPRLARPQQAADFVMEVREASDAGL